MADRDVRLAVERAAHATAASALVGGNHGAALAYEALTSALADSGRMAGSDATAAEFASGYDVAARSAVDALYHLVHAQAGLARVLATSGDNWAAAEGGATVGVPLPVLDGAGSLPDSPVDVYPRPVPASLGADAVDLPPFWNHLVDHLQGFAWPDASTSHLHDTARAWRAAGDRVEHLTAYADRSRAALDALRAPEAPLARQALHDLAGGIAGLAAELRLLGQACDDYADTVQAHRAAVRGILRELAAEFAASAVLGAGLAALSAGVGAAAGAGLAASRIAVAVARVVGVLRALREAARARAVLVLERVAARLTPLTAHFTRWAHARQMVESARQVRLERTVLDARHFDPRDLHGMSDRQVDKLLEGWPVEPSRSGGGVTYRDPATPGRRIRVMPGYRDGNRPDALTHGPYVVVSQNGVKTKVPLRGNPG